jgi:hypothetical protein
MEQHAVPTEAGLLAVDGLGGGAKVTGDLAVGHAACGLGEQLGEDIGSFEPVGCGEGLTTEGAPAVEACKPLDAVWFELAVVETDLLVVPA